MELPLLPTSPLVTVVCVCYNQADYVEYALTSVLNQTYTSIELIVVDDSSTDHSWLLICDFAKRHPGIQVLQNAQNSGNCAAFNRGLALAKGKYLIDLAADDLLLPERVARQVALFESLAESYGVIFGNVELIDKRGISLGYFYPAGAGHTGHHPIPSGDIYEAIVRRSFISAPSMMMRKQVLTALGGYDESLSYEDFDFWVRSARRYQYYFQPEVLTQKRVLPQSHGRSYRKHLRSSRIVCQKIAQLNRLPAENEALAERIRYFLRQCWFWGEYEEGAFFLQLYQTVGHPHVQVLLLRWLLRRRVPIRPLYEWYRHWRAK